MVDKDDSDNAPRRNPFMLEYNSLGVILELLLDKDLEHQRSV